MKTLYKIGLCIIIFWAVVFARDSFISTWRIPVDIGRQKITYRFPLEPNYRYKIKVVAYHEASGQWREWVRIDDGPKHQIKYNPYQPETLEFWVPRHFIGMAPLMWYLIESRVHLLLPDRFTFIATNMKKVKVVVQWHRKRNC